MIAHYSNKSGAISALRALGYIWQYPRLSYRRPEPRHEMADTYDSSTGWYCPHYSDGSCMILIKHSPLDFSIRPVDQETGEYERDEREEAAYLEKIERDNQMAERARQRAQERIPSAPQQPQPQPSHDRPTQPIAPADQPCTCYSCSRSPKPHRTGKNHVIIPLAVPGTGEAVHVCAAAWHDRRKTIPPDLRRQIPHPRTIQEYSLLWFGADNQQPDPLALATKLDL